MNGPVAIPATFALITGTMTEWLALFVAFSLMAGYAGVIPACLVCVTLVNACSNILQACVKALSILYLWLLRMEYQIC